MGLPNPTSASVARKRMTTLETMCPVVCAIAFATSPVLLRAGIAEFDQQECVHVLDPDCEIAKELTPKKKPFPPLPVVATRKPLVVVNISTSGGAVTLNASSILPMSYPVRKDLTMEIAECIKATFHAIKKLDATVVCINGDCGGYMTTLGGGSDPNLYAKLSTGPTSRSRAAARYATTCRSP